MSEEKRYCFVGDDDGHDYLIPVERREEFRLLIVNGYATNDFGQFEDEFESMRIGSCRLFSFTSPEWTGG